MEKNKLYIVVVVVGLLVLGAVLLGQDNNSESETNTSTETSESETTIEDISDEISDDIGTSDEFERISMQNFSYSEDTINAKPGETVKIELTNAGGTHDFVIDELDVNTGIVPSGDTVTFEFTIPEDASGKTFAYYCSVGNHRAQGMEGQVVVE